MRRILRFVGKFVLLFIVFVLTPLLSIVAPGIVLAQSADPYEKYRQFERRVCVHPPNVSKNYSKWAMYPNGTLATYKEGEFYAYLPAGALIYIFDPHAPGCRNGKPVPTAEATQQPGAPPGAPLSPASDEPNGDKEGRRQAESDARKKAAVAAAKAAEEAKEQAEKEAERKKRQREEAAKAAEESRREEAKQKAEVDEAARKKRAERQTEEQHRKRNSPEARWSRGQAILPPASQHTLPPASEHELAKVCEPSERSGMAPIRSLGAECMQVAQGEEIALPSTCKPPLEGAAPIRSLGTSCKGGEPAFQATNESHETKETDETQEENDPSTLERFARELVYFAAISSGQFSEETAKNGDPYGILGGKNIGGSSNPYVQIAAAVGMIIANAAPSPAQFRKAFLATLAKGERVVLTTTSEAMENVAEQLAKSYGKRIAAALEQNGMIAPYRLMRKFTDRLGGLYQAHHILEVARFKQFFPRMNPDLGPAVILTAAKHAEITAALRIETAGAQSKEALLAVYKKVYEESPHWVKAIESYFAK